MNRTIIYLILVLSVLSSCTTKDPLSEGDDSGLRITHTEMFFSYEKTRYPVTVMTDRAWTITSDVPWLTATVEGADHGLSFFVEAELNDEGVLRKGVLTLTNVRGSRTISVYQSPDTRNFTDIFFTATPSSYDRVEGASLVIPYRKGGNMVLDEISVSVAGVSKGSVSVETLHDVRLNEEDGEIRLDVSGRVGPAGKLLFTVSGLPPTVFGDAAQCMVTVSGTGEMLEYSISDLYAFSKGTLEQAGKIKGIFISDIGGGNIEEGKAVLQDEEAGVVINLPSGMDVACGDEYEIFISGSELSENNGVLCLTVSHADDMELLSVGNVPVPISINTISADYMSMLCCIDLAQIAEGDMAKPTYAGLTELECYGWNETVYIYVSDQAGFAAEKPAVGSGKLVGIVGAEPVGGKLVIMPRNRNDLAAMTAERLVMNAVWAVDREVLNNVSASGSDEESFQITSSVPWTLTSDGSDWIYDWSVTSSQGGEEPVKVAFKVKPNTGARRSAVITISGEGVPDKLIKVIQLEGSRILDEDFDGIRLSLEESPKYFPSSGAIDYAKSFEDIGLSGWYSTNCYGAFTPDGTNCLLRIGKTYTKGYIQTPPFAAIGSDPVNVQVEFLAGILNGCKANWMGLELYGPGEIVVGEDVVEITKYDEVYTDALVETLPMFVVQGLSTKELKRVSVRIEGADQDTMLRLTATCKGGSTAADCNMFFIGDLHVEYVD